MSLMHTQTGAVNTSATMEQQDVERPLILSEEEGDRSDEGIFGDANDEISMNPLETTPTDDYSVQEGNNSINDDFRQVLRQYQNTSIIAAHCLALVAMITVIWWISLLGGLSWEQGKAKLVFNWHPLLMVSAFCFMTVASLSFRLRAMEGRRQTAKLLHGTAWFIAALCAVVALVAVLHSHNDSESGYIANMYSLHSWIGMFVIALYIFQFLSGFFTFGWRVTSSNLSQLFKSKILTLHYFIGPFVYIATCVTVLLGLQEKEGFVGCSYKVDNIDRFPWMHFMDIPLICRVSHMIGIIVLVMTLCTMFAMHDFGRGSYRSH